MTMACQSQSCIEPYLETFIQSFADNNYSSWTIRNYRARIRCLGRIMDAEGIAPCSLTADLASDWRERWRPALTEQSSSLLSRVSSHSISSISVLHPRHP